MEKINIDKCFVYSECFDCGLILKKCLESFFKYHPDTKVNIFGTAKDFKEMGKFKNVEYFELSDDQELKQCFEHGHMGTAHIGARVIKEFSEGYDYIIHFDSDVIFRKESLSLLIDKISENYSLIGPRRCYKNNMNGRKDLGELSDVTQTYFYAFDKTKISDYDFPTLRQMIVGFYNPLGHPTLDYFDPVGFDILKNGGNVFFLDVDDVGGLTEEGDRKNKYLDLNNDNDVGDFIIHFGGIGSGKKFITKGNGSVPDSYVKWASERYSLYHKLFYGTEIEGVEYDKEKYELLKKELINQ